MDGITSGTRRTSEHGAVASSQSFHSAGTSGSSTWVVEWRARTEHRDQRFPSAEAIVGWIDNPCLIPFVQALPTDLRKPFRDAVVEAMLARTRQPDGTYLEPFRRINVWVRKAA